MNRIRWDIPLFGLLVFGVGLASGWAWHNKAHAADAHTEDAAHGAAPATGVSAEGFPEQTLRNMGVNTGEAKATTFTKTHPVMATLRSLKMNDHLVTAPIGGRIIECPWQPEDLVSEGDILVRILRDPIPRPTLTLTEPLLKPAHEEIHQAVVDLRRTRDEIQILESELERIGKLTQVIGGEELPLVPRQTAIDVRYNLTRAKGNHERARLELTKHGFDESEVTKIAEGGSLPHLDREKWLRALKANGLWTAAAQQLFEALPKTLQADRWTIATIGELATAGLLTESLQSWIQELGPDINHFLEIGALIQAGHTISDVRSRFERGVFEDVVEVPIPNARGISAWDIDEVLVRPGQHIKEGTPLARATSQVVMQLWTQDLQSEKPSVREAILSGSDLLAKSLFTNGTPDLEGVRFHRLSSSDRQQGLVAIANVKNSAETRELRDGRRVRSWKLQEGQQFLIQVPETKLENVFVLPRGAVAQDGPHRVVFVPDGDSFRDLEVEVAYMDESIAVLPRSKDCPIFEGDQIVLSGAYELSMALRSAGQAVDPHAGHSH